MKQHTKVNTYISFSKLTTCYFPSLDKVKPELTCSNSPQVFMVTTNVNLSPIGYTVPTATDNSGGTITYTTSLSNPASLAVPSTTQVTVTATDESGNQDTCIITLEVQGDFLSIWSYM